MSKTAVQRDENNDSASAKIRGPALTFDDVLLIPSHSSTLPNKVDTKTRFSRSIELQTPLVSAAMDTVTESRLAIALAKEGGIGIIHKNASPELQAREVEKAHHRVHEIEKQIARLKQQKKETDSQEAIVALQE